jgi:response regulator of citrate/malate metabolism
MSREIEQYQQAGMDDYLAKPLEMNKLITIIHKWGDAREHPSANKATELYGRDLAEKNNR